MSKKRKKLLGLVIVSLVIAFSFTSTFQSFANFPNEVRMFESAIKQLKIDLPISATALVSSSSDILEVNGQELNNESREVKVNLDDDLTVKSIKEGESKLTLKLFGVIPLKTVNFNVMKDIKVIPGGQTIGVKLKSAGIIVVGHHSIEQEDGKSISPAEKAGIRTGDLIIKMDGKNVTSVNEIVEGVNEKKGKEIEFEIVRDKEKITTKIKPIYDSKSNAYRLGLYIRDSAAGVGTLTFYDPNSNYYGALGHVITDIDTQEPIVVGNGKIFNANVTSIDKGSSGKPGGKRAQIEDENHVIGSITKNTPFGIFGEMYEKPSNGIYDEPIPIALPEEVKEGPAEILTVIEGQKVEKFDIEIVNVIDQKYPATKGMVIKVTDKRLLEKTGGIIQGMSGSPIIQDNKLVGVVTHVFVNEPTSGYGSFIEWMIRDAGILESDNTQNLKAS